MGHRDRDEELRRAALALWLSRGSADGPTDVRTILGRPNPADGRLTRTAELLDVTPEELIDVFESVVEASGES